MWQYSRYVTVWLLLAHFELVQFDHTHFDFARYECAQLDLAHFRFVNFIFAQFEITLQHF